MNIVRRSLVLVALPIAIGLFAAAAHGPSKTSADDPSPPTDTVKLIFVHHSTGENWLNDDWGGLGIALRDNNYFVSDTNYGWGPDGIGDLTDIGHWWNWFRGPSSVTSMNALFNESEQNCWYSRRVNDPGGSNEIIMFKSCFPNSNLQGDPNAPATVGTNALRGEDAYSEHFTVANAKGIYNDILEYFRTRQDKLFIVITAPPLSEPDQPANARAFNNWLVNDWLDDYPHHNVAVFDFYTVLTSNGGSYEISDLGAASGNHHRWYSGTVQHITDQGDDIAAYPSDPWGDDHPNEAGSRKATGEFVDLLNIFYHRFKGAGSPTPTPTPTVTATPTPTPTPHTESQPPRRATGRRSTGTSPTPTPTPTPTQGPGNTIVSLTVHETNGIDRFAEPVTSGIPLPASAGIRRTSTLGLLDAYGKALPAQFKALARWGGAPDDEAKPIRWLLVDFQTDITANHDVGVDLATGCDIAAYPTLNIGFSGSAITIDTGVASYVINRTDGSLTGTNLAQRVYGRITDATGTTYTTSGDAEVVVEAAGPMRSAIRVRGSYRSTAGTQLLEYTSRYWFFAGSATIRVFHTIENNNLCTIDGEGQPICNDFGTPGSVDIRDASLVLPSDLEGDLHFTASGEGEVINGAVSGDLVLYQDSSGADSWDHYATLTDWDGEEIDARPRLQASVSFRGYRTTLGGNIIDSGNHNDGWLQLTGNNGEVAVLVRDFWQNFPKALRAATDGTIEIGLFPDEFGPENHTFNLRCGEHKTHEMTFFSSSGAATEPLFAAATSAWYVASGAFGFMALPDAVAWPDYENYVANQLDTAPTYADWMNWFPNLPTAIEATDFYGIFDYGDVPLDYEGLLVSPMNLKYNMDLGMWKQWARGGDLRWFNLADAAGRHIADIDILHNLHPVRYWSDGIIFGHSYHDELGLTNPHRNYGGSHPDTMFGVPGLLMTYYLTGYDKALEAAIEVADCIEYRTHNDINLCPYFSDCNGEGWGLGDYPLQLYNSNTRPVANSLAILVEAHRATADSRYLDVAEAIIDLSSAENQPYINGPTGEDILLKPWLINTYLITLSSYLEMASEFGLTDISAARQSLLDYAVFLKTWVWLNLDPIDTGSRAAYPYEWYLNEAAANNEPSINNWLLAGADAMAYVYLLSGDDDDLERAAQLFRTGSRDPWYEDDENTYSSTKETANSVVFGHIFLHQWAAKKKK